MSAVYLGVDWGRRRVGVAVSDELGRMAHPLVTLEPKSENALKTGYKISWPKDMDVNVVD